MAKPSSPDDRGRGVAGEFKSSEAPAVEPGTPAGPPRAKAKTSRARAKSAGPGEAAAVDSRTVETAPAEPSIVAEAVASEAAPGPLAAPGAAASVESRAPETAPAEPLPIEAAPRAAAAAARSEAAPAPRAIGASGSPPGPTPLPNVEALSRNIARAVEEGGRLLAAYLKPFESGESKKAQGDEVVDVVATLGRVAEYYAADATRAFEAQASLSRQFFDL